LTIDTSRPAVTAVAVPLDGTYKAGDRLEFTITADENVTVSGTPRLALLLDTGGVVHANYLSGSGSQNLVFAIALGAGLKDSDGIAITGLELNGGALRDAAGNALDLTLNNVASTAGILVDSIVPGGDPEPTIVDLGSATGPIVAGPGPENFQGTDNIDAVRFTGSRSDYRIDRNSDGSYTITGPGAPDTVNAIERLQFDDGILALDTDANPGLAFRLYRASVSGSTSWTRARSRRCRWRRTSSSRPSSPLFTATTGPCPPTASFRCSTQMSSAASPMPKASSSGNRPSARATAMTGCCRCSRKARRTRISSPTSSPAASGTNSSLAFCPAGMTGRAIFLFP
jgi:hypothetical protein